MSIKLPDFRVTLKKQPILVLCAIIGVVLLGVLYFRFDDIAAQQAELEKKSAEGQRYRTNLSYASQLTDQLDIVVEANAKIEARALRPDQLALNLQYFYRLEAETGIKYTDLRPGGAAVVKAGMRYIPVTFNLAAQGSYAQIIDFIRRLERGPHFCRINTLGAVSVGDGVNLSLNVDLLGLP